MIKAKITKDSIFGIGAVTEGDIAELLTSEEAIKKYPIEKEDIESLTISEPSIIGWYDRGDDVIQVYDDEMEVIEEY